MLSLDVPPTLLAIADVFIYKRADRSRPPSSSLAGTPLVAVEQPWAPEVPGVQRRPRGPSALRQQAASLDLRWACEVAVAASRAWHLLLEAAAMATP